jgi:hypothetical protein
MALPNFVVIGAARSGTTSLFHHLRRHPQVYMAPILDPRFFAFEGDSLNYRGPGDHLLKERIVTRLEDYLALFAAVTDEIAIGEVSPAYLSSASAAARIRHYIPHARIIGILRNPVERAISSFRLERLRGFEPVSDLAQAITLEDSRMRNNWSYVWQYTGRGLYYTHLQRYFDLFPREQILIGLYEDWQGGGRQLLRSTFQFLGVDDTIGVPDIAVRHNSTNASLYKARGLERFEPTPELRARLAKAFRDEIKMLENLIERDLTMWLQGP